MCRAVRLAHNVGFIYMRFQHAEIEQIAFSAMEHAVHLKPVKCPSAKAKLSMFSMVRDLKTFSLSLRKHFNSVSQTAV